MGERATRSDLQRLLLTEEALAIKTNETPAGASTRLLLFPFSRF
jgi:hypothetical protein